MSYGKTDDFSYNVAEDPVAVRDLHATLLHQLGIDHQKLNFPIQGLDQKLTGWKRHRWLKKDWLNLAAGSRCLDGGGQC